MLTYKTTANLRLRQAPGLGKETIGEIHAGMLAYGSGEEMTVDDLRWAELVAPCVDGAWRHGWSAMRYDGDDLLTPVATSDRYLAPVGRVTPISQMFGENPATYGQFGYLGHNGIDFACPVGDAIYSVFPGTVTHARVDSGYGNYVRIDHIDGAITLYAHLFQITVTEGQAVGAGSQIGLSGNSGFSSGPHLHFELRVPPIKENGFGGRVDPYAYIKRDLCMLPSYLPPKLQAMIRG